MRIMGLDLSIAETGVCEPNGGTFSLPQKAAWGDSRLRRIRDSLKATVIDLGVEFAVIEDLPTHAHGAGITGMVHGAVRLALADLGVPYVVLTPATLKKFATGKGNSNKTAMALHAFKRAGREFGDDNQCDAWWLWAAGMDHFGPALFPLPVAQRAALDVITWDPRI